MPAFNAPINDILQAIQAADAQYARMQQQKMMMAAGQREAELQPGRLKEQQFTIQQLEEAIKQSQQQRQFFGQTPAETQQPTQGQPIGFADMVQRTKKALAPLSNEELQILTGAEQSARYKGDPDEWQKAVSSVASKRMAAQGAPLAPEEISRRNQILTDRYRVLNPDKPLPAHYSLGFGATEKTFSEIDKALEQIERAKGTKAQQDQVNAMRQQTYQLAKGKVDIENEAMDVAAQSLASGDLTRLRDISSLRGSQRLLIYSRAKKLNPNFNMAQVDRQIKMMELYTTGKQGDQLQSFGTFLEHAGALHQTVESLKGATDYKILNAPINWLRQNVGNDARYQQVLAALDPVQKEFESYLLNNRALYTEDRATVDKIINGDLSLLQMEGALRQMGHTVQARYNEADSRFRNTMRGKGIEELIGPLTDEAKAAASKIGVNLGSMSGGQSAPGGKWNPKTGRYE